MAPLKKTQCFRSRAVTLHIPQFFGSEFPPPKSGNELSKTIPSTVRRSEKVQVATMGSMLTSKHSNLNTAPHSVPVPGPVLGSSGSRSTCVPCTLGLVLLTTALGASRRTPLHGAVSYACDLPTASIYSRPWSNDQMGPVSIRRAGPDSACSGERPPGRLLGLSFQPQWIGKACSTGLLHSCWPPWTLLPRPGLGCGHSKVLERWPQLASSPSPWRCWQQKCSREGQTLCVLKGFTRSSRKTQPGSNTCEA